MGMFSRFTDIVNANINSLLDKAEHPEKMIKLIIQEMEETLVEVRSTAAKHIAEKKSCRWRVHLVHLASIMWLPCCSPIPRIFSSQLTLSTQGDYSNPPCVGSVS